MSFQNWKNGDACIGSPDSYLGVLGMLTQFQYYQDMQYAKYNY